MTSHGQGTFWGIFIVGMLAQTDAGLFICAISGALLFMAWAEELGWFKRIIYSFTGTSLGYIFGPILTVAPWTPNWDPKFYALLVSTFGVLLVNKVIVFINEHSLSEILEKIRGARK